MGSLRSTQKTARLGAMPYAVRAEFPLSLCSIGLLQS